MARNGSGTYFLPPSNPVVSGTVIESNWANDTMSDIAAALSQSMAYDGQTVPIANLQMGGFHHTNVSDPTSRNQYVTLGMAQDYRVSRVQGLTGVDNLVGTLIGGATAYMAGALVNFFAPATNTGAMTLNYNGIGARSLTDSNGLAIAPGAIQAGQFVIAVYTGTEFRLLSQVDAAVAADLYNLSITGQIRPPSDVYPSLTIATASSVNIPAGEAWINPPGNDPDDAVKVSWPAQTLILQFLASSFTTFIMVDSTGSLQQIPGRAVGANFRSMALIGVVEHITGVVNNVITRPSIFGDDGYRARDQASLLANTIANGGLVTPNAVSTLNLDVAQGTIFIPGGSANSVDSPNTFNIPPQANIQFRTLAGQNTLSGLTSAVPVGSYDLNGAGVVAALPNPGDATIHRLYYLYGQYVLAYGQQAYSSVENALSFIAWDRTKYKKSLYLADATLMAEIVAIRTATNLNILTQGAVVCPGGINFSIGSPGGIAEAPIDGFPYGRRNAAWFQVLGAVNPTATGSMTVSGAAPVLHFGLNPVGASTSGYDVFSGAFKWYAEEIVNPDDKVYFRSYNPASGALRFTTTYDLATGNWIMPSSLGVGANLVMNGASGNPARIMGDMSTNTNNRLMFQTTTVNAGSTVIAIPNGIPTPSFFDAAFVAASRVDTLNASTATLGVIHGQEVRLSSDKQGTGAYLGMTFHVNAAEMMRLKTDASVDFPGNVRRITANFSDGTPSNRMLFMTNVPNAVTAVGIIPNGTAVVSGISAHNSSNINNSPYIAMNCLSSEGQIDVNRNGVGNLLPFTVNTGGLQRLRIDAAGAFNIVNDSGIYSGQMSQGNNGANVRASRVVNGNSNYEIVNANNSAVTHTWLNSGGILLGGSINTFADNTGNCGNAGQRWGTVFAITPTINTSDGREKTPLAPLTPAELTAAKELSKSIGTFQWLQSIEEKGTDKARIHVGVIAQEVIAIMTKHGLNPMRYGFVCYDEWDAIPARIDEVEREDEEGNKYTEMVEMIPEVKAGNRYGVRYEELAMFMIRGQEQRLAYLEARMGL